jgi:hypothetical protein
MPFKLALTLFLFLNLTATIAQDSASLSKNNSRSNIVIISRDGLQIKGRVMEITLDYIVLDARDHNNPVNLSAYYIRPKGDYYKIDVEYLQAAVFKAKKKTGRSAAAGAVTGAVMGIQSTENTGASVSEAAAASGAGLAIGGLVGTAKGLGRKKMVIPIYGQSENLIRLLNYYE